MVHLLYGPIICAKNIITIFLPRSKCPQDLNDMLFDGYLMVIQSYITKTFGDKLVSLLNKWAEI